VDGVSVLKQGWGMIHVCAAWEYLKKHSSAANDDVDCHFRIRVMNNGVVNRGIYHTVDPNDGQNGTDKYNVQIHPTFPSHDTTPEMQTRRIEAEWHVNLVASHDWMVCPEHMVLLHGGKSFALRIVSNHVDLVAGVHVGHVRGFVEDVDGGSRCLFQVPVTVIVPLGSHTTTMTMMKDDDHAVVDIGEVTFEPAQARHYFLTPPSGATWMDVTLTSNDDAADDGQKQDSSNSNNGMLVLHVLQKLPHTPYRDNECKKYIMLSTHTTVVSIPIQSDADTIELCLARYWSAVDTTNVSCMVQYRGIQPSPSNVVLCGASSPSPVQIMVHSALQDEMLTVNAKLTKWRTPLRPIARGVITKMTNIRDAYPENDVHCRSMHAMVLQYECTLSSTDSFTPRVPALQGYLYEAEMEGQFIICHDKCKKVLGFADAWPSEISCSKAVGTEKGDCKVILRLQLRHERVSVLEQFQQLEIWLERKLKDALSLSAYPTHGAAVLGNVKGNSDAINCKQRLKRGKTATVFLAGPNVEKLPKGHKCGDILLGSVTYCSSDANLMGVGKKPGGFPLRYIVGTALLPEKSSTKDDGASEDEEVSAEEKMQEEILKLKCSSLEKLMSSAVKSKETESDEPNAAATEKTKFEVLYEKLVAEHPTHLPLLLIGLKYYDDEKRRSDNLARVIQACDNIMSRVDENEMAMHYGVAHDKDDPSVKKKCKDVDEKKVLLVEALARRARAAADAEGDGNVISFEGAMKHLRKWVPDVDSSAKYAVLALEKDKRAQRTGLVLKLLDKLLKTDDATTGSICVLSRKKLWERKIEVLRELHYDHLADLESSRLTSAYPNAHALF